MTDEELIKGLRQEMSKNKLEIAALKEEMIKKDYLINKLKCEISAQNP